jgi:NAD+ synthase (glutamine-hydrolysing)
MKIALAQINTTVGDVQGNRDRVIQVVEGVNSQGADLVVFPELCLSGYPPRDLLGLSGFVEANHAALWEIASRADRVAIIIGFVDRNKNDEGKEHFNAAAFIQQGRIDRIVHKTLLPTYDVFDEARYFEGARDTVLVSFMDRLLGISLCEDAWNAEDFWTKRLYHRDPISSQVESGADLLINISASPFEMDKPRIRYRMLLDHVEKHGLPLVYLNLVGGNDDLIFDGNSLVLGRSGNLIAQAKSFEEDVLLIDPDLEVNLDYKEAEPEACLFDALVMGTRDYAAKCGFQNAVLGLSGGIDSAVTACIAAEALGPEHVLGVSMPSAYSQTASRDDAQALAHSLGIGFKVIPIQPIFQSYLSSLRQSFEGRAEDTTEENIQARIRGNILMALSNKYGHLVLSTGNKSELAVGYCTLYGDMAGGLAVISDVPKMGVYKLAHYINRYRETIPRNTIRRAPSAELRPDQRDQDSLPEYETLDAILRLLVEEQMGVEEIMNHGFEESTVRAVVDMVHQSEYKRQQAAPGLRVTTRAFGHGWRMPVAKTLNYKL